MININDTILYGSEGVCTVVDIVERDFGGKAMQYYVLKPVYNNSSTIDRQDAQDSVQRGDLRHNSGHARRGIYVDRGRKRAQGKV